MSTADAPGPTADDERAAREVTKILRLSLHEDEFYFLAMCFARHRVHGKSEAAHEIGEMLGVAS